jgi:exopolysaccharide biosynthesis polyprenyl glycosylphosphotransferase
MVKEWQKDRVVGGARVLADTIAIGAGFAACAHLHEGLLSVGLISPARAVTGVPQLDYPQLAGVFASISILSFWHRGLYRPRASILNLWELETALQATMAATAYFFALLFVLKIGGYSRTNVMAGIATGALFIVLERRVLATIFRSMQLRGRMGRRVVIYGCDAVGRLLMKKIIAAPHMGCTVVGFIDDVALPGSTVACRVWQLGSRMFEARVLGRWPSFAQVISIHRIDELLIVPSAVHGERLDDIIQFCRERGVGVGIVPQVGVQQLRVDQIEVEDVSAVPVLRPIPAAARRLMYRVVKRVLDFTIAATLLLVMAPVWAIAALLIVLDSRGPVLFRQERVGRDGRRFCMLKFRTMRTDAEPYAYSPAGDIDPRITRVGRVLRMTGLDELPQLVNVLCGEMSLVGPRPEMPFIVADYTPLQRQRLLATPGITGLWQLSADRHAQIHENIEYDLYYIRHQSLMLDALVLLETVFFTAGLVLRGIRSSSDSEQRPAAEHGPPDSVDEPYVLLALDQRRERTVPAAWRVFVPALCELAEHRSVKILVAPGNVDAHDQLLDELLTRLGTDRRRPSITYHRTRAELRSFVLGATAVITDLPHVARWARASGRALLSVNGVEASWEISTQAAQDIIHELDQILAHAIEPFSTCVEGWESTPSLPHSAHSHAGLNATSERPSYQVDRPATT